MKKWVTAVQLISIDICTPFSDQKLLLYKYTNEEILVGY
jgi:hypothetical protein